MLFRELNPTLLWPTNPNFKSTLTQYNTAYHTTRHCSNKDFCFKKLENIRFFIFLYDWFYVSLALDSWLDLHMVIRAGILADIHKKYIIWQLLKALKYLHSAGEWFRDVIYSFLSIHPFIHSFIYSFLSFYPSILMRADYFASLSSG